MKKSLLCILLVTALILSIGLAAAQYETTSTAIQKAMGSMLGVIGGTIESLFVLPLKILIFVLLVVMLYQPAMPIAGHKPSLAMLISVIVSILCVQALPGDWLKIFLATYGALAGAVIIFLPIMLLFFFSRRFANTVLFVPIWITALIIFIVLALGGLGIPEFNQPVFATLSMIGAIIALVVVMNRRGLKNMINDALMSEKRDIKRRLNEIDAEIHSRSVTPERIADLEKMERGLRAHLKDIEEQLAGM